MASCAIQHPQTYSISQRFSCNNYTVYYPVVKVGLPLSQNQEKVHGQIENRRWRRGKDKEGRKPQSLHGGGWRASFLPNQWNNPWTCGFPLQGIAASPKGKTKAVGKVWMQGVWQFPFPLYNLCVQKDQECYSSLTHKEARRKRRGYQASESALLPKNACAKKKTPRQTNASFPASHPTSKGSRARTMQAAPLPFRAGKTTAGGRAIKGLADLSACSLRVQPDGRKRLLQEQTRRLGEDPGWYKTAQSQPAP